jgi:hypothetical protein
VKKLIYGKVTLYEIKCKSCDELNLTSDPFGECEVCKEILQDRKIKNKAIIVSTKRGKISAKLKREIKANQDNCCYWCGRMFGTLYEKNNKINTLKIHYDHKVPFAYLQSNPDFNWVGACNICNTWKSSKIFSEEGLCKDHLNNKWDKYLETEKIKILA